MAVMISLSIIIFIYLIYYGKKVYEKDVEQLENSIINNNTQNDIT